LPSAAAPFTFAAAARVPEDARRRVRLLREVVGVMSGKGRQAVVALALCLAVGCSPAATPDKPAADKTADKAAGKPDAEPIRLALVKESELRRQKSITDLAKGVRAIDLRACPPDFQEAFLKLVYLYEAAAAKYPRRQGEGEPKIDDLGRYPNLFAPMDAQGVEKLAKEIQDARQEVEKVGLRYGAQAGLSP
jgi:hypothetical protein